MHPIEEELEKLDLHYIYEVMDATDALALLREHVRRLKLPANPDGHPNSPAYGHLKLPHLN